MSELNIRRNGETGSVSHSIFLFGMPKVGKTTEACKFPNPLAVECEPRGAQYVANVDGSKFPGLHARPGRVRAQH